MSNVMATTAGKVARCANSDCLNIYLMSFNEDEKFRAFCPVCRSVIFEAAFDQPDDEDHKSDA